MNSKTELGITAPIAPSALTDLRDKAYYLYTRVSNGIREFRTDHPYAFALVVFGVPTLGVSVACNLLEWLGGGGGSEVTPNPTFIAANATNMAVPTQTPLSPFLYETANAMQATSDFLNSPVTTATAEALRSAP